MTAEALPPEFALCYSQAEIAARAAELGREICGWVETAEEDTKQPVLAVCVLRGGVFFFADLVRSVPRSIDAVFCRVKAYSIETNTLAPEARISPFEFEVSGRAVLLIDDICESGTTLSKLTETCVAQKAAVVRSVVAIHRRTPDCRYQPTWSAFVYEGTEWFVGYGLDSNDRFRNLPDIYVIRK
jgi:hypoxanthine phosphoribosyltransferase